MEDIKRMQELAGIDEISVSKPINKRKLLEDFLEGEHFWLLHQLSESTNLDDFLESEECDSLEEYLNLLDYDNPEYITNLINGYLSSFKPNEIYVVTTDFDYEHENTLPSVYKKIITTGNGDDNYIILHNL